MNPIRRGQVYLADLNPPHGTEPGKRRPVVVVQSDLLNDAEHPSTLVCPITSQVVEKAEYLRVNVFPGETGLEKKSAILVDQLRAIDNRRLVSRLGRVSDSVLDRLSDRLIKVLDLE